MTNSQNGKYGMSQYVNPIVADLDGPSVDPTYGAVGLETHTTTPDPQPIDQTDFPPQSQAFFNVIPVGGTAVRIGGQLGFIGKCVKISNYSGQWWFAPFLDIYIMPYHVLVTENLPHGATAWELIPETPAGFQNRAVAGQPVLLTFLDTIQPPSPGISFALTNVAQAVT